MRCFQYFDIFQKVKSTVSKEVVQISSKIIPLLHGRYIYIYRAYHYYMAGTYIYRAYHYYLAGTYIYRAYHYYLAGTYIYRAYHHYLAGTYIYIQSIPLLLGRYIYIHVLYPNISLKHNPSLTSSIHCFILDATNLLLLEVVA